MKRIITFIATCAILMAFPTTASAYNYDFGSGPDYNAIFGGATGTDEPVPPDPMSENTRRNKDAASLPPPYFYGSGDIPTDTASPYHDNTQGGALSGISGSIVYTDGNSGNGNTVGTGNGSNTGNNATSGNGTGTNNTSTSTVSISPPAAPGFQASTSTVAINTEPLYYANGSIGTIHIARTNKTITVYEGEQLANLDKGAGHFTGTSAWDGNVALCGHNRGNAAYFSFVKDMRTGDKVTYTTQYGTRTYEVISKEQIGEYDYSKLAWSAENLLTLITCVENTPELRWAAVLREVR